MKMLAWVAALMVAVATWTAQAADCYSDGLMAYVDSRIPSGNQTERRWERIKAALLEQDGGMELAEAERILEARRSRGLFLEHMDEVVEAIKCLDEPDEEVIVPPEPEEPEDPPQPLQGDPDTPAPQTADNTSMRAYFHDDGPTHTLTAGEYRINEDDNWESELILHYESNQDLPDDPLALSGMAFCINQDIWGGPDYWNNGPITLSGFTQVSDKLRLPTISPEHGLWRCTDSLSVEPNTTIVDNNGDGNTTVEVVYRAKVRTRDNNVVEDDFKVTDLEFRVLDTFSGSTIWRTETDPVADRSWWRMLDNEVAWPDYPHTEFALGDGSSWNLMKRDDTTCGEVANSRWTDRADVSTGTYVQDLVRANDETLWVLDHCFPTVQVPKIPPTPPNTQPTDHDDTSLPIIEEDDVSWIKLHKANGKWTVSVYKPVMVTDGDAWWNTSEGLAFSIVSTNGKANRTYLIPATDGIVADKDYKLHELRRISSTGLQLTTFGGYCTPPGDYGNDFRLETNKSQTLVRNNTLTSVAGQENGLELDLPARNTNLCR